MTSFVGRRHEVAEVKRLLSGSHLVTLTGVGGVGKTRLAEHVAAEVCRAFADGVWLIELAELDNPELLGSTVAEALEIQDRSGRPPVGVLIDHLRDKRTLLILDNCEHMLTECAVLAETLLRFAPQLRILATSRQPLGIAAEQTLAVPTLPLPDAGGRPGAGSLLRSDAVRLFAERARAVLPGFAVTAANREVVERICCRLDGIPLGIELAAVRLRALSVQQLLDRLDDRFRLLTAGSRAVLPRHQTLRALFDWSYALCTDQERLMWARVSVFSGGLDLEAIEAVCTGDGIAAEEAVDLAIGLVDKSVLIREEHPTGVRYRLLETIRAYGRERLLASGEEAVLRRRHRDHYRELSAEAYRRLFGPDQVAWFTRLRLEHANLRIALEYCFAEPGEAKIGLDMAADLLHHWVTSYYLSEGRSWLDQGLAADTEPSAVRARALWVGSWPAIIQAQPEPAAAMLKESRALGERLDLEAVLGYVALYSGVVAMSGGDAESAIALYTEAVARHRATGDPMGLALALIRLSLAHCLLGDVPRAISIAEQSVAVCDAHAERWHRAYALMALGIGRWRQGDTRRASELVQESLSFSRSLDDPLGTGVNLEVLAWIAATDEDYTRAAMLLGILKTVGQAIGPPLSGYGCLAVYHGECESAVRQGLGEAAFRKAVGQGAELCYDEALAYALGEQAPVAEPPDRTGQPSARLTRREAQIAQLIAQGMSNKEIAATLVIARRTAEGHIEHILDKLGFNSRTQIATWVSGHEPGTGEDHPSR